MLACPDLELLKKREEVAVAPGIVDLLPGYQDTPAGLSSSAVCSMGKMAS